LSQPDVAPNWSPDVAEDLKRKTCIVQIHMQRSAVQVQSVILSPFPQPVKCSLPSASLFAKAASHMLRRQHLTANTKEDGGLYEVCLPRASTKWQCRFSTQVRALVTMDSVRSIAAPVLCSCGLCLKGRKGSGIPASRKYSAEAASNDPIHSECLPRPPLTPSSRSWVFRST
jgi:hypothetical protein